MSDDFSYIQEDRELFLEFLKTGTVWGIYKGMPKAEIIEKFGQAEKSYSCPWHETPESDISRELYILVYGDVEVYLSETSEAFGIGFWSDYQIPQMNGEPFRTISEFLAWLEDSHLLQKIELVEVTRFDVQLTSNVLIYGHLESRPDGQQAVNIVAERFFH